MHIFTSLWSYILTVLHEYLLYELIKFGECLLHSVQNLSSSCLLPKDVKIKIFYLLYCMGEEFGLLH